MARWRGWRGWRDHNTVIASGREATWLVIIVEMQRHDCDSSSPSTGLRRVRSPGRLSVSRRPPGPSLGLPALR